MSTYTLKLQHTSKQLLDNNQPIYNYVETTLDDCCRQIWSHLILDAIDQATNIINNPQQSQILIPSVSVICHGDIITTHMLAPYFMKCKIFTCGYGGHLSYLIHIKCPIQSIITTDYNYNYSLNRRFNQSYWNYRYLNQLAHLWLYANQSIINKINSNPIAYVDNHKYTQHQINQQMLNDHFQR